jgi:hypothetical protein
MADEPDFLDAITDDSKAPGNDRIIAVFPGMARSIAEHEAFARRCQTDPEASLPTAFIDEAGNLEPLNRAELETLAAFNVSYGENWSESDWRALHGYPPLEQEKSK